MSFLQKTWGKAAAGAATGLLTLLAVEAVLRVAGVPEPGLYDGDPNTRWWLRSDLHTEIEGPAGPFLLETNELGLRGELPPEEGDWTLALGCSTTLGWGVEESEAWPAQLSDRIGEPVINAGQPGWSTEQAVGHVDEWLELKPTRVIIGYIVRDAQASSRPDAEAQPTPWWARTSIARLIRQAGRSEAASAYAVGSPEQTRVPPDIYRENLARLIEMSTGAEVILLSFPQVEPLTPWEEVQDELGRIWTPRLEPDSFFADDPIHLTSAGHQALADWMALELQTPGPL